MPWKTEADLEQEDHTPVTIQKLKETVEVLCQDNRTSPTEIRQVEEPSVNQLKSIVAHFQKLFDITSIGGVFPRMNEVYLRLGETYNAMNNMREFIGLGKNMWETYLYEVWMIHFIIQSLSMYCKLNPFFFTPKEYSKNTLVRTYLFGNIGSCILGYRVFTVFSILFTLPFQFIYVWITQTEIHTWSRSAKFIYISAQVS